MCDFCFGTFLFLDVFKTYFQVSREKNTSCESVYKHFFLVWLYISVLLYFFIQFVCILAVVYLIAFWLSFLVSRVKYCFTVR